VLRGRLTAGLRRYSAALAKAAAKGGSASSVVLEGHGAVLRLPDVKMESVLGAGVNVMVGTGSGESQPRRAAQRRAKSPTAARYDSRRQAARM
jgi:hypothetical protein